MKSKKLLIIIAVVILATLVFAGCNNNKVDYDVNIVANGGFEDYNGADSMADGWSLRQGTSVSWGRNEGQTSEYNSALGKRYLMLNPTSSGYYNVNRQVKLEKNAVYKISAYINAQSLNGTAGVYFEDSIDSVGIVLSEANEGWTQYTAYFTSSVKGNATLVVAVGKSSQSASGTVYFDNISIEKVENAPDDVEPVILRMTEGYDMADGGSTAFVVLFTLLSAGIAVGMFFMIKSILKNNKGMVPNDGVTGGDRFLNVMTGNTAKFIYVLLAAFIVRFITVLASADGNAVIDGWISLANGIANDGIISYYSKSAYEPQGMIWLMGILGYLGNAMNMEEVGYSILLRMPMVIADLTICYMIYSCAAKYQNERMAVTYGFIYAILPIFFLFGSLYGSYQTIGMAFLVAMALAMLKKSYVSSGIYYTLALAFSNYALVLLPVILLYQIYAMATDKSSVLKIALTMAGSFVAFYILSLPLCWEQVSKGGVFTVFVRMYEYFNVANPKLADDTFNLYSIFAAGGKIRPDNIILNIGNWLFVIGMSAYVVYHYIRTANRLDLVLLSGVMLVAYSAIGAQSTLDIMPIGLVLILLYLVITPDLRLYISTNALATLSFLNIAALLSRSGYISGVDNATWLSFESKNAFLIIFSILTVLATLYTLYVAIDSTLAGNVLLIEKERELTPIEDVQHKEAIEAPKNGKSGKNTKKA